MNQDKTFQMKPGLWYRIPGSNGYEITVDESITYTNTFDPTIYRNFTVRSFKNFKKYPNGYLIKQHGNMFPDYSWEMTDNNNRRRRVTLEDIIQRLIDCDYVNTPRESWMMDIESRNRIMENAGVNKHPLPPGFKTDLRPARFTIVKSPDNLK